MDHVSITSTVGQLVAERPSRARLFEQLGLDYCCGGKASLEEACRGRGLDAPTVAAMLTAADAVGGDEPADWSRASVGDLCDHIIDVHHAFLRRELPRLSTLLEKVDRAHGAERPEVPELRATFERLRAELDHHLVEEEDEVFPACRALDDGAGGARELAMSVAQLETEHAATGALLRRLSELTGGYDLDGASCNTHRAALDGLRELERDLHEHIHEENNVLFPRVVAIG